MPGGSGSDGARRIGRTGGSGNELPNLSRALRIRAMKSILMSGLVLMTLGCAIIHPFWMEKDRKRIIALEEQVGTLQEAVLQIQGRERLNVKTANLNTNTIDQHTTAIVGIVKALEAVVAHQ